MPDTLREKVANRLRLVIYDDDPRCMPQAEAEADAICAIFAEERAVSSTSVTWCPQCGPDVKVDEDGCCSSCGADATGPGAIRANLAVRSKQSAEAREAKLVEALAKYGDHLVTCRTNNPAHGYECDCGYVETIAALATVKEGK